MNKLVTLAIALLIIPLVSAEIGYVGEVMTLWADIIDGAQYYNAQSANISIYYPNGSVAVSNTAMTLVAQGRYKYNFTPNVTGVYYTSTQFSNSTGLVAIGTGVFAVEQMPTLKDENMSGITTLIALGLVAGLLIILAFKMDKDFAWLKEVFVVFAVLIMVGIAGTALLHKDDCVLTSTNGALTKQCVASSETIRSVEWWLFSITLVILSILIASIIIVFFIKAVKKFQESGEKLR